MVYGGTIMPGQSQLDHRTIDIESAFQSFGAPDPALDVHRGTARSLFAGSGCSRRVQHQAQLP